VTLLVHPAATLFPMMDAEALQALADDIREHGQREPVILYHGAVLDGRNRLRACELAGVEPRFVTRTDAEVGDPIDFVLSLNKHRRHLEPPQLAALSVRISAAYAVAAAERHRLASAKGGSAERKAGTESVPAFTAPERDPDARSLTQAAKAVGAGREATERMAAVLRVAPEVFAAVESGLIATVTDAKAAAALPKAQRAEFMQRVETGGEERTAALKQLRAPAVLAEAKAIRNERGEARRTERMETLAAIATGNRGLDGVGTFPVIYADPPWRYDVVESESRAIENHYPTMSNEDIYALPIQSLCTDDAVLFLWATSPKLVEAIQVVAAWGFTYKTCMVWAKDKIGMGYYARQQHELLLIATRGAPPTPAPADRPSSIVNATRGEHSAKPTEFYELIERMYPALPKIELFCRSPRDGWSAWGNQS
jgi:N6-adenosine-specific RNA methylase IME4